MRPRRRSNGSICTGGDCEGGLEVEAGGFVVVEAVVEVEVVVEDMAWCRK